MTRHLHHKTLAVLVVVVRVVITQMLPLLAQSIPAAAAVEILLLALHTLVLGVAHRAAPASSSFATHFNWRNTWHTLQK